MMPQGMPSFARTSRALRHQSHRLNSAMFHNAPDQVGAFLGGLFMHLVRSRAHELSGEIPVEQWQAQRHAYIVTAYRDVIESFPDPLRAMLAANEDAFIATALRLN